MKENNKISLVGVFSENPVFSHEVMGEKFYKGSLESKRLSGVSDRVPVIISERLLDMQEDHKGQLVALNGQFRSFDNNKGEKKKLDLFAFVSEIEFPENCPRDQNNISFRGFICKEPVYRQTPLGREIVDFLIAVNRQYGKSDYIPCIAWGRNARFIAGLSVGDNIRIYGRVQSREYVKKIGGEPEKKTAYEVSVCAVGKGDCDELSKS